jgi:hypothetical protein
MKIPEPSIGAVFARRRTPAELAAARRIVDEQAELKARESRGLAPLPPDVAATRRRLVLAYEKAEGEELQRIGREIARIDGTATGAEVPMPADLRAFFASRTAPRAPAVRA